MRKLMSQRGDTIIEVMVAFAVFAMVAVGAITVMNQGTAGAQDTLETTQVRQQIDNQAEMLRFLHQAYLANPDDTTAGGLPDKFRTIVALAKNAEAAGIREPTAFGAACTNSLPLPAYRFMLDPSTGARLTPANVLPANNASAPPYARVAAGPSGLTSYGMWIEPILSNANVSSGTTQYVDFHVRACWNSASGATPQRTLGTIVRLYVPDNVDTGTSGGEGTVIPTPPPDEFTIPGAFADPCYPHKDVEREDAEGSPGFAPFDPNGIETNHPPEWRCQRPGSAVFSCVNYDAQFSPNIPAEASGSYDMTISYYDANCGNAAITVPFTFKVRVYKNNAYVGDYDLSTVQSSRTIDIGAVNQSTTVQIRWWNNHFFAGTQDPDFAITQLIFKRKS